MLSLLTLLWTQTTINGTQSLINPGFEAGNFTGFTTLDNVDGGPPPPPPINDIATSSDNGDFLMVQPTEGRFFALLNTVRDSYRLRQSVLIQENFAVTIGANLSVDLNYMTGEFNTGPETNDTAYVYVTIKETGEVLPVAFFSRDQLQLGGTGEPLAGTLRNVGHFKLSTGWRTYYVDLSKYAGKSAFLTFNVRKAAPSLGVGAQNTALAIDNIRLN